MSIHKSAIVHPEAEIGEGVVIGPFSVIGKVKIGEGTRVASNVVIEDGADIGKECHIAPGVLIGGPPQHVHIRDVNSFVKIGDQNVIREYVTIHRSLYEGRSTQIGDRNFLMAYAHVAHDCLIGNDVVLTSYTGLSGHVVVENRAVISGFVGIHQFVRIGALAIVGGGAVVTQDILPFVMATGNPAKVHGLNSVGLRRYNISPKVRSDLKKAFKLLYRSNLNTTQALSRIREEVEMSEEIEQLIHFVESSKRGICK